MTKNLWKHDLFVITLSEWFQVGTSATCVSEKTSGTNYYNSTSSSHSLNCEATAVHRINSATPAEAPTYSPQELFIWGNKADVLLEQAEFSDAKSVTIAVSDITNPYAKGLPSNNYVWKIRT